MSHGMAPRRPVLAFAACVALAASCTGGSRKAPVTASMVEASGGADLTIDESPTCAETICLQVTWAGPQQGYLPVARHVRLAGLVGDDWRVAWERHESAPFAGDGAFEIPLGAEDQDWLAASDEVVLSVTQIDAPVGGGAPRVRVTSRPAMDPGGGATHSTAVGPGLDLPGASLEAAWLSGLDLSGTNLDGADLRGASLRGANLAGASLAAVDLAGVDLAGARWLDGQECEDPSLGACTLALSSGMSSGTIVTITYESPDLTMECAAHPQDDTLHPARMGFIPPNATGSFAGSMASPQVLFECRFGSSFWRQLRVIAHQPRAATSHIEACLWDRWFSPNDCVVLRTAKEGASTQLRFPEASIVLTRWGRDGRKNVTWGAKVSARWIAAPAPAEANRGPRFPGTP